MGFLGVFSKTSTAAGKHNRENPSDNTYDSPEDDLAYSESRNVDLSYKGGSSQKGQSKHHHHHHDESDVDSGSGSGGGSSSNSASGASSSETSKSSASGFSSAFSGGFSFLMRETHIVSLFYFAALGMLVTSGVLVSQAAYSYSTNNQEDRFQEEFQYQAEAIARRAVGAITTMEGELYTQTLTLAMDAAETNQTWPFVTFDNFEIRGQDALALAFGDRLMTIPLVTEEQRAEYENYTVHNQGWIADGIEFRNSLIPEGEEKEEVSPLPIFPFIYAFEETGIVPDPGPADPFYVPIWQLSPATDGLVPFVNINMMRVGTTSRAVENMMKYQESTISGFIPGYQNQTEEGPRSIVLEPILKNMVSSTIFQKEERRNRRRIEQEGDEMNNNDDELVAIVGLSLWWDLFLDQVATENSFAGLVFVLFNCDDSVTYQTIENGRVKYLGEGDLFAGEYRELSVSIDLDTASVVTQEQIELKNTLGTEDDHCVFHLTIYPSDDLRSTYENNDPLVFTATASFVFALSVTCFLVYGVFVGQREKNSVTSAARSNALINSLFPKNVRDRLLNQHARRPVAANPSSGAVKAALPYTKHDDSEIDNLPIADLFPNCTVMFGDLVGFTAWSSAREPTQVFKLLETVYFCFDSLARKRRVFKVETIGDSYVAVCGLPEKRKNHATVMCRFAFDCLANLRDVVNTLEIQLGPGTSALSMRFGLHSGPVIAGVLRGEKSRFQLFGDTVNLASKMESMGKKGLVQLSQQTADLLAQANKSRWFRPREDLVDIKSKGLLQTYWLSINADSTHSDRTSSVSESNNTDDESVNFFDTDLLVASSANTKHGPGEMSEQTTRLIEWMVEMLRHSLRKIVAMREQIEFAKIVQAEDFDIQAPSVLDEVKEIIKLPGKALQYQRNPDKVELNPRVEEQLAEFVRTIAGMYRNVPFHNFEHASHVTMSVTKLLARIVSTQDIDYATMEYKETDAAILHGNTYGITSDPLTQFALTLSALIHDVDHTGVPNAVLIKEKSTLAELYNNKSVAEQNSVDLAWDLLMEPTYDDLRSCICSTNDECNRFRQLLVNAIMATDIADKELGSLRKARWEKAFSPDHVDPDPLDTVNRKATIVIEHLMQASDVAHTMQHWHVYQKWNEKFFHECYHAYKEGRVEDDPSVNWYKGEIGFFDFYIIPLAKKLQNCGVFGVSSDEYLNYATMNREEWEAKGESIVEKYIETFEQKYCETYEISLKD